MPRSTVPPRVARRRPPLAILSIAVLAAAAGFAACNPSGSGPLSSLSVPSVGLPSVEVPSVGVPSVGLPTLGAAGTPAADCVGPFVAMVLTRLQQQGVDVEATLQQYSVALIAALQTWTPQESARTSWRDQLAAALQAKDYAKAAATMQQLTSGKVTVTPC
jgi:hypothetical protein